MSGRSESRAEHTNENFDQAVHDSKQMRKEISNWAILLFVLGVAKIIFAPHVDDGSSVLFILVSLSSFYFRSAAMFVVYGVLFSWAVVANGLAAMDGMSIVSTRATEDVSNLAFIVPLVFAIRTIDRYFHWRKLVPESTFAGEQGSRDVEKSAARPARLFPWIASLLGPISLAGYIALAGFVIYRLISENRDVDQATLQIMEGLLASFALLGFSTGLASLMQRYRHKWLSMIGLVTAGLTLLIGVGFLLLGLYYQR